MPPQDETKNLYRRLKSGYCLKEDENKNPYRRLESGYCLKEDENKNPYRRLKSGYCLKEDENMGSTELTPPLAHSPLLESQLTRRIVTAPFGYISNS